MVPSEISLNPGRKMINAPIRPTITAMIRLNRIVSPRNSTAPTVTKIGPVKLSAVISAIGIRVSAVKPHIMPIKLMKARPKNSLGLFMRMLSLPLRISTGAMISSARKFRKKITSRTCTCAEASRMQMPISINMNMASSIMREACSAAGNFWNRVIKTVLSDVCSF